MQRELLTIFSMMMNSSQQMSRWQDYFDEPTGNRLGLMNNMYNIGSIVSFFLVPFLTQWTGRKIPIAVGCSITVPTTAGRRKRLLYGSISRCTQSFMF